MKNYRAIEMQNKRKFLAINPILDDESGCYILIRKDENEINFAYIGQARRILSRLAQHMTSWQHIDLSLKKHGLISPDNPHGWRVGFVHCPESELDSLEKHLIKTYATSGYQLLNKTAGGQGEGKSQISEYRPAKGYHDGLEQGRKNLARELRHIIEKHLEINLKAEKQNNKVSIKALDKFWALLEEGENDGKSGSQTDSE